MDRDEYMGRGSQYVRVGFVGKTQQGCTYKIIGYEGATKVLVEFQDANKHKKFVDAKAIKTGNFKNPFHPFVCGVGYFGIGSFPCTVKINGVKKNSEAYEVWRGLLRRCYSLDYQEKRAKTYEGCFVNPIWHNFQNFAYWFYNHPIRQKGWELDKDLIVRYNREYGPLRCTFIPQEINTATTTNKAKRGEYPLGVYKRKCNGKFVAQLGKGGNNQILLVETFDLQEAWLAYKSGKEAYMKELGEMWEGKLDSRVIISLKNWAVQETD